MSWQPRPFWPFLTGFSVDEIGRLALLNGLGQLLGGVLFPAVSHKIKHLRWQLVIAMGLQLLFCILYTIAIPGNRWMFAAFQIFGQGAFGCSKSIYTTPIPLLTFFAYSHFTHASFSCATA